MANEQRLDETVPGGHYIGTDGKPHDADGNPVSAKASAGASTAAGRDYTEMSKEDLQAEATTRGLTVTGTGADGNVLKADLVKALEKSDAK